ncbi:GlsB/YeaQ/YmgE family stress response membrane protein [Luteimonas aquatica]|uniref:GlsB/YeaQ/YmgE family stress response membrane protein n=1 Tax=Luteimonas aquatica TaxID=450364 RepID=UPI001F564B2D|nr:GlsB/YeaQ/YmgE family stress response membrane protein [Luteimonas aquatica]
MLNGFFGYIIGGAVIGILARLFKPGADPMGWIMTILLGIAGAAIAGYLYAGHGIWTWAVAILASIALLFVFEMIRKKR